MPGLGKIALTGSLLIGLIVVVAIPVAMRPKVVSASDGAERIVIISPHNEQIRTEFERAFSDWHLENYGAPVDIDFRRPGGTSEIRKQIKAIYEAAVRRGDIRPDGAVEEGVIMPYDLLFGGGTYEHDQMKKGVRVELDSGEQITVPISIPANFDQAQIDRWFGENRVGAVNLYDEEQYFLGVALSSFGILFNRDALAERGLAEPEGWRDLADYNYVRGLALGDPRQSGSVATTYESILNSHGWDEGWRILRAMAANTRSFVIDSKKVVLDVSQGESVAGVAIDFYGRYQSQAVREPGQSASESRLGYVDPVGSVYVDPDPISLMRGGPNPTVGRRFLEFALTEQGQAIWQLRAVGLDAEPTELGPREYELRRMPIRRIMYEKHFDLFIDKTRPFEAASTAPTRGWRSLLGPIFGAFSIDLHSEIKAAWTAMNEARLAGADPELVERMEELFYAMPVHTMLDGRQLELTPDTYPEIREEWRDRQRAAELQIEYAAFFRKKYREVVRLAREARHG